MWASLMSRKYRFIQIATAVLACTSIFFIIPKENNKYIIYFIYCIPFFLTEIKGEILNLKSFIFSVIRIILFWIILVFLAFYIF